MPGFRIGGNQGCGDDSQPPFNTVEPKRKHRWVFRNIGTLDYSFLVFLLKCNRPKFTFEKAEMHHNQEVAYFAGRQKWDTLKMTFYDVEQPDSSQGLWNWLQTVVNIKTACVADPSVYKLNDSNLEVIDGMGQPVEQWSLYGAWPADINWQELDYGSNDILQCDVEVSYDRAMRVK